MLEHKYHFAVNLTQMCFLSTGEVVGVRLEGPHFTGTIFMIGDQTFKLGDTFGREILRLSHEYFNDPRLTLLPEMADALMNPWMRYRRDDGEWRWGVKHQAQSYIEDRKIHALLKMYEYKLSDCCTFQGRRLCYLMLTHPDAAAPISRDRDGSYPDLLLVIDLDTKSLVNRYYLNSALEEKSLCLLEFVSVRENCGAVFCHFCFFKNPNYFR